MLNILCGAVGNMIIFSYSPIKASGCHTNGLPGAWGTVNGKRKPSRPEPGRFRLPLRFQFSLSFRILMFRPPSVSGVHRQKNPAYGWALY